MVAKVLIPPSNSVSSASSQLSEWNSTRKGTDAAAKDGYTYCVDVSLVKGSFFWDPESGHGFDSIPYLRK